MMISNLDSVKYSTRSSLVPDTYFSFYLAIVFLKLVIVISLPPYILADTPHDDAWVINRASYLLNGQWLGPYDQFTLIKGVFSPALMALSFKLRISFNVLNEVLYCLSCFAFVRAFRPVMKYEWVGVVIFIILVFNPITMGLETGQRIYRNGIGQWQIVLIVACISALLVRRKETWNSLVTWSVLGGSTIGAFFLSREDANWLLPFLIVSTLTLVTHHWFTEKFNTKKVIVFLLPMVISWSMSVGVSSINYLKYGSFLTNDRSGGNFPLVAGDLYKISPDAQDEERFTSGKYRGFYINIYRSSLDKAFAVSPTLNSVSDHIRASIAQWSNWERDNDSGELSTDHMIFAIRDGVRASGLYRSLPNTEKFYGQIHKEISAAFSDGRLKARGFSISPLIMPVDWAVIREAIFDLFIDAAYKIVRFDGIGASAIAPIGSVIGIEKFERIASVDGFIKSTKLIGSGWAFLENGADHLHAGIYDRDNVLIKTVPFKKSDDVFSHFDFKFTNAKSSRFSFSLDGYEKNDDLKLRFTNGGGTLIWEIDPRVGNGCGGQEGIYRYCLDEMTYKSEQNRREVAVNRANYVISLFRLLSPFLFVASMLIFSISTALLIFKFRSPNTVVLYSIWLPSLGILLTAVLFLLGMCIISARSFYSLFYLYCGPAYVLLLMFYVLQIATAVSFVSSNYEQP